MTELPVFKVPDPTAYTYYDPATGEILACGKTYDVEAARPSASAALLEGVAGEMRKQYVHQDNLVDIPAKPGDWYEWSWLSYSWEIPNTALLEAKKWKKLQVDSKRALANELPISYAGSSFDADSLAQGNVMAWMVNISNGLVVPVGFTWRDASNVDHPADAAFISGLGAAMVHRGSQLYQSAWNTKAAIDQLLSIEEVEACTITF